VIFVGGFDQKVYALDRDNGTLIWVNEDAEDRIIGGLAVGHGLVFVGVGNRGVFAFNQRNGEQEWFFNTGHGIWSTPLILEDIVVVTALDHHIYGLNLETGEERWRQDLEGAVAGTPAYDEEAGVLYAGSFARKLYAIAASDGAILDTFDTHGWLWGGPRLEDGVLYFGDLEGYLYALEAATFEPLWQRQIAEGAIRATPLVVGETVIAGSRDGRVYAVNRDSGASIWMQPLGADVLADPVLVGENTVIVSTLASDRVLVALEADNGQEVWQYPPAAADSQ
jgi:outer membrane protein assembly factor BamB